jgi:hypothetical protein
MYMRYRHARPILDLHTAACFGKYVKEAYVGASPSEIEGFVARVHQQHLGHSTRALINSATESRQRIILGGKGNSITVYETIDSNLDHDRSEQQRTRSATE